MGRRLQSAARAIPEMPEARRDIARRCIAEGHGDGCLATGRGGTEVGYRWRGGDGDSAGFGDCIAATGAGHGQLYGIGASRRISMGGRLLGTAHAIPEMPDPPCDTA